VGKKGASGQRALLLDTVVIGVAGALAARLFAALLGLANTLLLGGIARYHAPGLAVDGGPVDQLLGPYGLWVIPVCTALGGLAVGVILLVSSESEGHGTDVAVRAFHRNNGTLRARVPPAKMLASAITIGSGGAAGREGPVALISAAIGSVYASFLHRTDEERRLLLLAGMAAGLSATFRSPIGTALFAIEVLYSDMEFEAGALVYTMLASIIAYAVNGIFVGWRPLFQLPDGITHPEFTGYAWYLALGVGSGIVATLLPQALYLVRDAFRRLKVPPVLKPALGGLGVGLLALELPQVLGGGYGWIQHAIDGQLVAGVLLALIFAKIVAMSFTIGSGGSGGVFAPSLFVGAMVGGLFADLFNQPPAPFVIVGMGAVFGGAAGVPLATLVMVTEMTEGYALLVPAALSITISYLVVKRLTAGAAYDSLYEAQVPHRGDSLAHHNEHLAIAFRILKQRGNVQVPPSVGEVDFVSLLRSGVPVDLPGDRRFAIGVLRPESALVNHTVAERRDILGPETEIISIIRGEHMMAARPDKPLEAGDRLVFLTTSEGFERLQEHVKPW